MLKFLYFSNRISSWIAKSKIGEIQSATARANRKKWGEGVCGFIYRYFTCETTLLSDIVS